MSRGIGVRGRVILTFSLLGIAFLAVVMKHEERVILIDSASAFYASCSRSMAIEASMALAHGDSPQMRKQVAMAAEGPGVQYAAIILRTGDVLASSDGPTPPLDSSSFVAQIEGAEIWALGQSSFLVLHPLGDPRNSEGKVVLVVSGDAVAERLRGDGRWRIWSLATMAVVAFAVALWADRHVSRSTRALLDATQAVAAGHLDRKVEIRTGDMLEKLGNDFNIMAERIKTGEERLRQVNGELNEKVSELGLLAAGLAHELNNPLAAISAMAEDLVDRIAQGSMNALDVARRLGAVSEEIMRCRRLVGDLLAYARPVAARGERTSLGPILQHVVYIAKNSHPDITMAIQTEIASDLPEVAGGPDAYQQVFFNLVSNAIDASPPSGTVRITAVKSKAGVRVEISDNGSGIPLNIAERIFEPFFTTKPAGKGTGLGLAIVRRIIDNLGGRVSLAKAGSPGATFVVEMTAAE